VNLQFFLPVDSLDFDSELAVLLFCELIGFLTSILQSYIPVNYLERWLVNLQFFIHHVFLGSLDSELAVLLTCRLLR